MEKSTKYIIWIGAIIVIGLIVFFFTTGIFGTANTVSSQIGNNANNNLAGSGNQNNQANPQATGEVQQMTLKVVRGNYVTDPTTIKKGIPVRMTVDMTTFVGCSQDIVIPAFNVRKYVTTADNIIEFTPTKSGVINMMCSMNMYRGTFTVID